MTITHGCRTCGAEFPEHRVDAFLRHTAWCQEALPPVGATTPEARLIQEAWRLTNAEWDALTIPGTP